MRRVAHIAAFRINNENALIIVKLGAGRLLRWNIGWLGEIPELVFSVVITIQAKVVLLHLCVVLIHTFETPMLPLRAFFLRIISRPSTIH